MKPTSTSEGRQDVRAIDNGAPWEQRACKETEPRIEEGKNNNAYRGFILRSDKPDKSSPTTRVSYDVYI
jgi:hypothetical protein